MTSAALALVPPSVFIRPLVEHRSRPHLVLVAGGRSDPPVVPAAPRAADIQRLLTGVLEVLDGRRPPSQLADVLPCRYQRALLTTALAVGPGPRTLRSVHLSRTGTDVVDLCARVEHGGRSRALTGRLVLRDDRWEFTLLELV